MRKASLLLLLLLAACAGRYKVLDPDSGRVYYTKRFQRDADGTVHFQDAETGREVTLENSEIERVSQERFEKGVAKR